MTSLSLLAGRTVDWFSPKGMGNNRKGRHSARDTDLARVHVRFQVRF